MKRLVAIFATLFLVTLTLKAEHFTFMGIPIDGSYEAVKAQLIKKGFTPNPDALETTPTSKWFTGSFAGYYPVDLEVRLSPITEKVYYIACRFAANSDVKTEFNGICKRIEDEYKVQPIEVKYKEKPDENKYRVRNYFIPANGDDQTIIGAIVVHWYTDETIMVAYVDNANNKLCLDEIEDTK